MPGSDPISLIEALARSTAPHQQRRIWQKHFAHRGLVTTAVEAAIERTLDFLEGNATSLKARVSKLLEANEAKLAARARQKELA